LAVKKIDKIIVLSKVIKNLVKKIYSLESKIIRSGININDFSKKPSSSFRKKYSLEKDFVLLQVGSVVPSKGQEASINSMKLLLRKHKNLKLIFIGPDSGEYAERLKEMVKEFSLEKNILFLGPVSDSTLKEAYASCDVFIFNAAQSWSLAVIEAMASKKAVIVSKDCGISEVIDSGKNGFSVDSSKPEEISNAVEELILDKNKLERISKNARDYVKKNLSWERYTQEMLEEYTNLIYSKSTQKK
jgi:glycosyltransferase involved in cell wall biosynthesis